MFPSGTFSAASNAASRTLSASAGVQASASSMITAVIAAINLFIWFSFRAEESLCGITSRFDVFRK
jgi:hypothetical protein